MLLEQGKGHHEVVFFYSCCGSLDQAARYIAEGFNGVLKHWRKRNSKPVLVIEYWNLGFHCNLVLGI